MEMNYDEMNEPNVDEAECEYEALPVHSRPDKPIAQLRKGTARRRDGDDIESLCSFINWNIAFWLNDDDPRRTKFIESWEREYGHDDVLGEGRCDNRAASTLNYLSNVQLNNITD